MLHTPLLDEGEPRRIEMHDIRERPNLEGKVEDRVFVHGQMEAKMVRRSSDSASDVVNRQAGTCS